MIDKFEEILLTLPMDDQRAVADIVDRMRQAASLSPLLAEVLLSQPEPAREVAGLLTEVAMLAAESHILALLITSGHGNKVRDALAADL